MFPVAAGIAERVGGAAALFKVIVSSFPEFFECNVVFIFYLLSFYTFIVYFPSSRAHLLQSWAMLVDPIIVGLNPSFDWVFIFLFFKYLFEEIIDVVFPSFSRSSNRSVSFIS